VDMGAGMLHQLVQRDLGPGDQLDIGAGQFAREGVGLADGGGGGDLGVGQQRVLDLGGVDIVAAADDQILGAPGDPQIAVGVHPAQVAGAQEAAFGEQVVVL